MQKKRFKFSLKKRGRLHIQTGLDELWMHLSQTSVSKFTKLRVFKLHFVFLILNKMIFKLVCYNIRGRQNMRTTLLKCLELAEGWAFFSPSEDDHKMDQPYSIMNIFNQPYPTMNVFNKYDILL